MPIFLLGSPQPYEGIVASRCRQHFTTDTTNKYMMSRSAHIASESLTSVKVVFSNFRNNGSGGADVGVGAASDITASIEYPQGTFTQVTFSASSSGSISNINILTSDSISVSIPAGATFWVNEFIHNTAGVFYNTWQNTFLGEKVELSATSITDRTMTGAITNSGSYSHPPLAVLGTTRNASVIILGDSIALGRPGGHDTEDTSSSATGYDGKVGVIARGLGSIPFVNLAAGGESAQDAVSNSTARKLIWQKSSHVICEYAGVDLRASANAATVISRLNAIYSNFASFQKIYQTTFTPLDVSSTDSYATLANQTPGASNAERISFNTSVRVGSVGRNGYYDVASALESSVNSGKWVVSPSPPYTTDGIHPNAAGNLLVQNANLYTGITYP